MPNLHRGEISARLDGEDRTLCLTLGALAELESRFAAHSISELAEKFGPGRLSSHDLIAIIACGLRGAGQPVAEDDVAAMRIEGGLPAAIDIVARLLVATFGEPETPPNPIHPQTPS